MNILQEIMKEGALIEPKAAEKISGMREAEQAEVLERVRKEKPLVIGADFFQNIVEVAEAGETKKFSVQESVARLNSYFSALQSVFEKKNRAVSIINASGNSGSASVIGLVKNILPDGFVLEDQTGEIKIISKIQAEEDDVIMVSGRVYGKSIYADSVEFPEVLEKPERKSPKKCEIVFGRISEGADYSITFGGEFSIGKKSLVVGKNPAMLKINNISVLINPAIAKIPPLQILKKRRLPGRLFAIAEAPDIFLTRSSENFSGNYKGTGVVAIDEKSVARINLKTREVEI